MLVTFALLTLAVLSLWLGHGRTTPTRQYSWLAVFVAALIAGLATGIVHPIGLVWVASFAVATYAFGSDAAPRWQRVIAAFVIIVLSAGLMAHQLPGFNNPRVISNATFSPDAIPFRLHLNFDKTIVGIFILGFCHSRIAHAAEWRLMGARGWPITAGLIGLLLVLSFGSGYVRFDPKFPKESWLWIAVNLCFTCVAEEALFRGFVQAQLQRLWHRVPRGEWLALSVAAVLFGLGWVAALWYLGLYRMRVRWRLLSEAQDIATATLLVLVMTLSTLSSVVSHHSGGDSSRLFGSDRVSSGSSGSPSSSRTR